VKDSLTGLAIQFEINHTLILNANQAYVAKIITGSSGEKNDKTGLERF
jgi:hypothetical protein